MLAFTGSALPPCVLESAAAAVAGFFVRALEGFGMTLSGKVGAAFRGDILTLSAALGCIWLSTVRSSSVFVRRFGSITMSCSSFVRLITGSRVGLVTAFLLGDAAALLLGDEVAFLLDELAVFVLIVFLGLLVTS